MSSSAPQIGNWHSEDSKYLGDSAALNGSKNSFWSGVEGEEGGVCMVYNGDWTKCHCPVHMHAQVVALSVNISVCEHENNILSKLGMLAVFLSTHKYTLLKLTNKSHSKSCEKQDFFAPCANY